MDTVQDILGSIFFSFSLKVLQNIILNCINYYIISNTCAIRKTTVTSQHFCCVRGMEKPQKHQYQTFLPLKGPSASASLIFPCSINCLKPEGEIMAM